MGTRTIDRSTAGAAARVSTWAGAGFVLYVAIGILSLFVVAATQGFVFGPFGIEVAAGTIGLSLRNGFHHIVWTLSVAGLAVPLGRRLVPGARFASPTGLILLIVGSALAGATEFLINEWARDRFMYYDPEYVGFAGFAPAAIVAVAAAAWAARCLPRRSRATLLIVLGLAVAGFGIAVLPSIGGLGDGIDPGSIPLASTLLADGAFAVIAVVIARR